FGWTYGTYWTMDRNAQHLKFAAESGSVHPEFRRATLEATYQEGIGLSGRTWKQRDLFCCDDLATMTDCCRAPVAKRVGIKSAVWFPITTQGRLAGTMEFTVNEVLTPTPERLDALRNVGRLVSLALERMTQTESQARIQSMVENAPTNVLLADRDLKI